ncbi:hypothetical protein D3C87_1286640 [compost metagenome]
MASSQPILLSRYGYDPLDRLISQFLAGATAHQRFYCKSRLSTEIQGVIGYSIFQKDNLLLAQQNRQHDAVESTLLATDLQCSVLQTLKADLRHLIAYSPYGHRRGESGLTSLLGFNGERADPVTGCYLLGNGYRAFNPVLMRFNSPDSLSPFGNGGLNPYAYCLADPVNFYDQNGHMPLSKIFTSSPSSRRALTAAKAPRNGYMQEIRMIDDAAFTFIDNYKGNTRLNIKAHGEPGISSKPSKIVFKDRQLTPEELHTELLQKNYDFEKYENIRILACHSAEGGRNSFAAEFSHLTRKPVKGYKGIVVANNDPQDILEQFNYSRQHYPDDPYSDIDTFFRTQTHHVKKGKSINFHPEKVLHIRNG